MEGNLGDSEQSPLPRGRLKTYAPWVLGVVGILVALWGLSMVIERMAAQPEAGVSQSASPAGILATGGTAHLDVKVLDDRGKEYPLGTPLPREVSLSILDSNGQEYSIPFDRVGVWAVDAPDGMYTIPEDQKKLGNWSWKMAGGGVKMDAKIKAWVVSISRAGKPAVLGITLF